MWNAKRFPAAAPATCSPCTSTNPLTLNAGAATTPSDSSTRACTSTCSATQPDCGASLAAVPKTAEPDALWTLVSSPGYPDRASKAIEQLAASPDPATIQLRLIECVAALGADSALFASIQRDGLEISACHVMLACDPEWFRHHFHSGEVLQHPWLAYAAHHAEPLLASELPDALPIDQVAPRACGAGAFASALLVPAHSGQGHARTSLLVLGCAQHGYFEGPGLGRLRIGARALAAELHGWWWARQRHELARRARLTPAELDLLRHERLGHGSKHIARALQTTESAVNSRFQRLNAKMGTHTRRAAARLAVESGLLPF